MSDIQGSVAINRTTFFIEGVITACLLVLPLVMKRTDVLNLLFLVFLFITLSQSWNILCGYAGQVNLGHAGFFGLGALVTRFLWLSGLPFLLTFFVGGVVSLIFAVIIGFPAFRLKGAYFVIGMLALAEIMSITVSNALPSISAMPAEYVAAYSLVPRYYLALLLAMAAVAAVYVLSKSKTGLGMLAVREDEDTAETSGVNTLKYKLVALGLSAFFAGLAGGTFAFFHVSYYPEHAFSVLWTFDSMFIAFIGGVGTVVGPIIGALFFVALREVFALVLPLEVHVILFGALFILVILFMPRGLVEVPARVGRILS